MDIWFDLKQDVAKQLGVDVLQIEEPDKEGFGDFAFPCFNIAKKKGVPPTEIAEALVRDLKIKNIKEIKVMGPYVNFYIDWKKVSSKILKAVNTKYGTSKEGKGKKIVIDFSSPNIAKPMGVGHLRSTIIGNSLYRIYKSLGYKCIADNHLGDWGTQFGKLITAYKMWGSEKQVKQDPIPELLKLYVRFHDEAITNEDLLEKAREEFKKLEDGNKENMKLWKWFKELSMKEFEKTYERLDIKFDIQNGESFYNKMIREVIEDAFKSNIVKRNPDGSIVISLKKYNMIDLLIQKSDGATLYATRDLATLKYRKKKYKFHKNIYVVGSEQKLHFKQFITAAELLGYEKAEKSIHVNFGLVSLPEGKMSTRKGRVVFLEDLINKAEELAEKLIEEKSPKLEKKKKIAHDVAIAAIIFNDLSTDRTKNIVFEWNRMLSFEGRSGPYVQYTHARASSILKKAKTKPTLKNVKNLETEVETEILKLLAKYPLIVKKSANDYKPHHLALYLFNLANKFNEFYQTTPVIKAENKSLKDARLKLVDSVKIVLNSGLYLLGIEAPEKM
ncbi:MAG: arginine--tRNA ligase [Candidatus Aenigmarchaeota archaeon]|nr:arginine--tRNA ligase [Candidatus Aenigmarchaeota archaeon]